MTVKLNVGESMALPHYKNIYRIEANYMHGDMNGSSAEIAIHKRKDIQNVNFDLEGLAFMLTLEAGQYGTTTEEAKEKIIEFFAARNNFNLSKSEVYNFIDTFVVDDQHDDSCEFAATLMGFSVYLFDEYGEMFKMEVEIDGKKYD